jgi:hypothetical protein
LKIYLKKKYAYNFNNVLKIDRRKLPSIRLTNEAQQRENE